MLKTLPAPNNILNKYYSDKWKGGEEDFSNLAIDPGYFLVANLVEREQVENLLDQLRSLNLAGQYYALNFAIIKACEKTLYTET